ncbi:unnamed protein product [Rotaria sp. Silwood1]|nr:unnamed protein product [Rotaria sp. Silwood1]
MLSLVCCCFPILTSSTASLPTSSIKHKRHTEYKQKKTFVISCPSSTPCELSSKIIPCTPTTADSVQHPFCDDSTITLNVDSSTLITDISSHETLNNSSCISATRELIETEQRYVNDLPIIANEFIKPLSNGRILND